MRILRTEARRAHNGQFASASAGGVAVAVAVELTSAVNCQQATIERKAESGDFRFEKKLLQETANWKC
jgi:hypothetical protein